MFCLALFILVLVVKISGQEADDVSYEGIGCYNDNGSRPLPIELKNFRETIDWDNEWPSFERVIRECAKLAHSEGYLYFAVQFYGECWTGTDAYKRFDEKGESTNCVHGVGKDWTNYVYMITTGREECKSSSYTELTEGDRSINQEFNGKVLCDNNLVKPGESKWFRFTGDAGNTLALSPPKTRYPCSTVSGGWMNRALPKQKDTAVDATVCFKNHSGPCNRLKLPIKVRNCGHFFVFKLQNTTTCQLRYCSAKVSIKEY